MCIQYIKLELVYQLSRTLLSYCMAVRIRIDTNKQTHTQQQPNRREMVFTEETVSLFAAVTICHGKRHTQ